MAVPSAARSIPIPASLMFPRPLSTLRLRVLSGCAALLAGALATFAAPAALRSRPKNIDAVPVPRATPFPAVPTVELDPVYDFSATDNNTGVNPDGAEPSALIPDAANGGFLGAADDGGANAFGTVFRVGTDGTFTTLHTFSGGVDGAFPNTALVAGGNGSYYGTTSSGGTNNSGTIFKIDATGAYSVILDLGTTTISSVEAALVADGNGNLYGTATEGGDHGNGAIFQVTTTGVYTLLHSFGVITNTATGTNADGVSPSAALVSDGSGNFLGVAASGGANNTGTIFTIAPNGTFTLLHNFSATDESGSINEEGINPNSALVAAGAGTFYGVTPAGGQNGEGTIFALTPGTTAATTTLDTVYAFSSVEIQSGNVLSTNDDGASPQAPLIYGLDGTLYGTTSFGGGDGYGTLFEFVPGGTGFYTLLTFTGNNGNGGQPLTSLLQTTTTDFYGTTAQFASGTVVSTVASGASGQPQVTAAHTSGTIFHLSVIPAAGKVGVVGTYEYSESSGQATIQVQRTISGTGAITVSYATANGTAFAGADYTAVSGTLSWADDETDIKTFTVPITDRKLHDGNTPSFQVVLGRPIGGAVLTGTSDISASTPVVIDHDDPLLAPVISSAISESGQVGTPFQYQITASNSPTSFGATNLPAGLSVNTASGLVSGTPTASGSFTFNISATNATGSGNSAVLLTVAALPAPVLSSSLTASGQVGSAFSYQIVASNSPTSYSAVGLPGGLTLNGANGLVSGTPTIAGRFTAVLSAANAGGSASVSVTFTISAAVVVAPMITSAASASATVGVPFTYQITATNNPASFGTGALPDGLSVNIATGLISGTPTAAGTFSLTLFAANAGGTTTGTLQLAITTATTQPTLAVTSPPNGITVFAGQSVPLAASVTDGDSTIVSVQFLLDGQVVATVGPDDAFSSSATPSTAGNHTVEAIATDALGRTFSGSVQITAVEPDASNPAPTVDLLTPVNSRNLAAGATLTLTATADTASAGGLDMVRILVDGQVIATFDADGNPITSGHADGSATPTVKDATIPTGLTKLFSTTYQLPAANKILTMIVTATNKLTHTTSVSGVSSFHSVVTSDRAPIVSFTNASSLAKVIVGSINPVLIAARDPDATTNAHPGDRPVRQDATSDAMLAQLEYWINGLNITKVPNTASLSYAFSPPTVGKYVFHAVATDGSGLTTISDPLIEEVDPVPPVVTVAKSGDGLAVEGGENGKVAVRRTGDLSAALTVHFKVKGTAVAGVDYKTGPLMSGTVTIPAGATQAKVKIKPIDNTTVDGTRTAKVRLLPSPDDTYTLGDVTVVKIKIIDND